MISMDLTTPLPLRFTKQMLRKSTRFLVYQTNLVCQKIKKIKKKKNNKKISPDRGYAGCSCLVLPQIRFTMAFNEESLFKKF